ncbi:hypothetical protein JKY72_00080, partial [Candidatus Gracilibacteria bacterium]|nr:hypothetical protein [Candidatus Gracilibacteria bacterium]
MSQGVFKSASGPEFFYEGDTDNTFVREAFNHVGLDRNLVELFDESFGLERVDIQAIHKICSVFALRIQEASFLPEDVLRVSRKFSSHSRVNTFEGQHLLTSFRHAISEAIIALMEVLEVDAPVELMPPELNENGSLTIEKDDGGTRLKELSFLQPQLEVQIAELLGCDFVDRLNEMLKSVADSIILRS